MKKERHCRSFFATFSLQAEEKKSPKKRSAERILSFRAFSRYLLKVLLVQPFLSRKGCEVFNESYFPKNFSAAAVMTSMPMGRASSMGAKPPLWMGTSFSAGIFGSRQPSQMKALGTFSQ